MTPRELPAPREQATGGLVRTLPAVALVVLHDEIVQRLKHQTLNRSPANGSKPFDCGLSLRRHPERGGDKGRSGLGSFVHGVHPHLLAAKVDATTRGATTCGSGKY
jgi:hypothetical protein